MERGQLIAYHRKRLKLTQTELGEKVNVTAQAVSKWEKGLSEPDLSTIQKLCKIFEIDVTEFFAEEPSEGTAENSPIEAPSEEAAPAISPSEKIKPAPSEEATPAAAPSEIVGPAAAPVIAEEAAPAVAAAPAKRPPVPVQPKIIVGYCDRCKRPIDQREKYTVEHHGRGAGVQYLYCPQCKHEMDLSNANYEYSHCKKMFKWSMLWGGIAGGAVVLLSVILAIVFKESLALLLLAVAAMAFAFTAQCFWNGFLIEFLQFFLHSFRMPLLIFHLDLNGIIWFITVKLFLMVLSGLLSVLLFILGLFLTFLISIFVFPFTLIAKLHQMKKLKETLERVKAEKV